MSQSSFDEMLAWAPAIPPFNSSVVLRLLCVPVILFACHLVYNLFFHPLAGFPGPIWGGLTDFYHLYLFGTKEYHIRALELHRQYGEYQPSKEEDDIEPGD